MEWEFISDEQRKRLTEARDILESVKSEINPNYKEFVLIQASSDSIEYAMEKERIYKS